MHDLVCCLIQNVSNWTRTRTKTRIKANRTNTRTRSSPQRGGVVGRCPPPIGHSSGSSQQHQGQIQGVEKTVVKVKVVVRHQEPEKGSFSFCLLNVIECLVSVHWMLSLLFVNKCWILEHSAFPRIQSWSPDSFLFYFYYCLPFNIIFLEIFIFKRNEAFYRNDIF